MIHIPTITYHDLMEKYPDAKDDIIILMTEKNYGFSLLKKSLIVFPVLTFLLGIYLGGIYG